MHLNRFITLFIFWPISFIPLPGSIMRFGLLSFHFFIISRIMLLPVWFTFMDTSTDPSCRPTTNPPMDCPGPQHLSGVPGQSLFLCSGLMFINGLVLEPGGTSLPKKPHLDAKSEGHKDGKNQWEVHQPVPLTL